MAKLKKKKKPQPKKIKKEKRPVAKKKLVSKKKPDKKNAKRSSSILARKEEVKKPKEQVNVTPAVNVSSKKGAENNYGLNEKEIIELEKKKKTYWTDDTELSVVEYLKNDFSFYKIQLHDYLKRCEKAKSPLDYEKINVLILKIEAAFAPEIIAIKNEIYNENIQKPLNKLVENIIFNFKLFRPGVDIKTLHDDCVSFVYQKLSNFNPENNAKSFSYYGTIAKHYLQGEKKDDDANVQTYLDYDDHKDEADGAETEEIGKTRVTDQSYKLFSYIISSIEADITSGKMSDNDIKVGDTLINIMKNHNIIKLYNKNLLYQLIRERTSMPTKDITYSLSRYRQFYKLIKERFVKKTDQIDHVEEEAVDAEYHEPIKLDKVKTSLTWEKFEGKYIPEGHEVQYFIGKGLMFKKKERN